MRKSLRVGRMRRRFVAAAGLGCALSFTLPARAADVTWQGDVTLNWATNANWDTAARPTLNDDALIDNGQTVSVISNVGTAGNVFLGGGSTVDISASGSLTVVTDFSVGSTSESPGTLRQSSGVLNVRQFLKIGDLAAGAYSISGGTTNIGQDGGVAALIAGASVDSTITVTGGELRQADVDADDTQTRNYLGRGPGGVTTVNLSAGTISMFASTTIAEGGATAVFNQTGGVYETRERNVVLGGPGTEESLSQATYDISGGTLSTALRLVVGGGDFATAELNIHGTADIQVGESMFIGLGESASGAQGEVTMSEGTMVLGLLRDPSNEPNIVGDDDLVVGLSSNAVGKLNLSNTADIQVGGALLVGGSTLRTEDNTDWIANVAHGEVLQSGGSVLVGALADPTNLPGTVGDDDLLIGQGLGSVGVYEITGGSLIVPGFAVVGANGSVDAELRISGDDTFLQLAGPERAFDVGGPTGRTPDHPNYGQATSGLVTQEGGTVFVDGQLQIGSGATADGVYDLRGGTLDVVGRTLLSVVEPFEFEPGEISTANSTFNQSGGESVFRSPISVGFFGTGVVNFTGGTLISNVPIDGISLAIGATDFSAGSRVNVSGGEFELQGTAIVGALSAKDVELNISGDAVVTFGDFLLVGSVSEADDQTSNEGRVNQSGGVVTVQGQLQLGSSQPAQGQTEAGRANGSYQISGGTLNLLETAFVGVDGAGTFHQSGGTVNAQNSIVLGELPGSEATFVLSGGTLQLNRGAIDKRAGEASIDMTGGRMDGVAFIAATLTQSGGVLATGGVPNDDQFEMITEIDGDYFVSDAGAIEVQIGGLLPITEYDIFLVRGVAHVGGSVNVSFTNDFTPLLGDEFEVLFSEGGDVIGQFDLLSFPDLPGLDGELDYRGESVFLRIVGPGGDVEGDTDDDGDVDITDLNNVRNNFGSAAPPIGDTDEDGDVDISDLNAVRNNFGVGQNSPLAASPSTA
ncbi:MAG: hypothetical protein SGJ19_03505, partial [Planctomycetia bacterium]|nr:hypothetical protein [Planctomycetia bacterium]